MLVTLVLAAALLTASAALGQAVLAACGWRGWRPWAPAVGYAILLALGGQVERFPHHQRGLAVALIVATAACLVLPPVWRALWRALPEGLPIAVLGLLAAAIPYFAYGRVGVLGVNVSNDMSSHLTEAFHLRTHVGWPAVGAIGGELDVAGYPIGPHGLASTLALQGIGDEKAFAAVMMVVPVLTALAALPLLPAARRVVRIAVAGLVGFTYLAVSFYAQASFKEIMEALALVALVAALSDLALRSPLPQPWRGGARSWAAALRRGIPLGALAGGTVYIYSFGGLTWPAAIVLGFAAVQALRHRRALGARIGSTLAMAGGALIGVAILALPDVSRMQTFSDSLFAHEPRKNRGNLPEPLSPIKALGVWLGSDFRFPPVHPTWLTYALVALAGAALVAGLGWWWRRRDLSAPVALAVSAAAWGYISLTRNIYNAGKGLAVLAPLAAVCIAAPLLGASTASTRVRARRAGVTAVRAVGVVLAVAAAASSFAVLRSAPVGIGPQDGELDALARITGGGPTLFLGRDHFTQWELRRTHWFTQPMIYSRHWQPLRADKPGGTALPLDFDNFGHSQLDAVEWVIAPRAAYASTPPANFRRERTTRSFVLYRRAGPTRIRHIIEPPDAPGAVLRCPSAEATHRLQVDRLAAVLPTPIVRDQTVWRGMPDVPGATAVARVRLPRGRWDVSLQYSNATGLDVTGPGLRATLPAYMARLGPYWAAGTVTSRGGVVTIRVTARQRTGFGRLIGGPRPWRVYGSPGFRPLNRIAFTRHGARPRLVPVAAACGRYVDWLVPKGA